MKNYSIYIVILLIISVCMSSCLKRTALYHFTQHDSLYFNIYDTLQSYTFKTNNGIDTFRITKKEVIEDYNEWFWDIGGGGPGYIFEAYSYCEGMLRHNGNDEEFYISFEKIKDNQDPEITIILAERYAMPVEDSRNFARPGIYRDVIVVDSMNSHQNDYFGPHYFVFESFKWHKYKGIVGYRLSDGTVYQDDSK